MEYRSQIKPLYGTPRSRAHWSSNGLCGNWIFNEGSGLIAHDDSGNDNHGTLTNMAPMSQTSGWVPGDNGGALAFPGASANMNCGSKQTLKNINAITILLNITPYSLAAGVYLICRSKSGTGMFQYGMFLTPTAFSFRYRGSNTGNPWQYFASSAGFSANNRYQLGITYTFNVGSSARLYKNGLSVVGNWTSGSGDVPGVPEEPAPVWISGYEGTSSNPFVGLISSVSIYNRALSAEEIAYLYQFPYCGYEDQKGMRDFLFNQNNASVMQKMYRQYSMGGN